MSNNNKKIKSITVIKDFPGNPFVLSNDGQMGVTPPHLDKLLVLQPQKYPEFFEIEYYPEKPKILKRPDGSLISKPKKGTKITIIDFDYTLMRGVYRDDLLNNNLLKQGKIFLREDEYLASKKGAMEEKRNEIQYEIDRLDAEEGWVADWKEGPEGRNQTFKYYLYFGHHKDSREVESYFTRNNQSESSYMSKKTAETILSKYTQDELKQYLGIII